MNKKKITNEDLKAMRQSITILYGVFKKTFYDILKKSSPKEVFLLEGRPSLDSAKVSLRELLKRKITPTIISDNMAGFLFYKGMVKEVYLAYQEADRKGAVCDCGALILAILSKDHNIPVKCFASERKTKFLGTTKDIVYFNGIKVAPKGVPAYVPLIEWVSKNYIAEIN